MVSPVCRVRFRGQRVHVKRDDVFHLAGNKCLRDDEVAHRSPLQQRKLFWFLQQTKPFFDGAHLMSFGGTQSNAMLAIAQLAHAKRVPFTYFSRELRVNSKRSALVDGNLAAAKALGMRHVELRVCDYQALAATKDMITLADQYRIRNDEKLVYIPQGAAFQQAELGLRVLADELNSYCEGDLSKLDQLAAPGSPRFSIVVPCGTGTTAFYLAQHLSPSIRIFAVPCVGDSSYLKDQLQALADTRDYPRCAIRMPELLVPTEKARFGRLAWPLLDLHHELLASTGIEFDLLYATFAWQTLFEPNNLAIATEDGAGDKPPRELLYVHTGGVSGNPSMLARYAARTRPGP